jgi:Xaa-Pro aminopeptidase
MRLTPETLPAIQQALSDAGVDGWLLYDFRATNPVAGQMLGLEGMVSRRVFCLVPRTGAPVAITHAIEQGPWTDWPRSWGKIVYSGWEPLTRELAALVNGKTLAMEYSPNDDVPYVDRIPAGVIDMVRAAGATVVTSGNLVSRFFAAWSADDVRVHSATAEALAAIADEVLKECGRRARSGKPVREFEAMQWVQEAFRARHLITDHGPNVSIGANAANPHYEPTAAQSDLVVTGQVLLLDLWAHPADGMWADQTWMAWVGDDAIPTRVQQAWEAVRDARDAAIAQLRTAHATGQPMRGADADDAARHLLIARGYEQQVLHRTGHSIDKISLHGSGPNLDNLESRDTRDLLPGCGFSVEPGVYFAGEFGIRSEVNGVIQTSGVVITPGAMQLEMLRV